MYNSKIKKIWRNILKKGARLDNEWHMIRGNIVYIENGKVIKRLSPNGKPTTHIDGRRA